MVNADDANSNASAGVNASTGAGSGGGGRWVRTVTVYEGTLANNTADAERLREALAEETKGQRIEIAIALLRQIPSLLRRYDGRVRCVLFDRRLVGVLDPDGQTPACGVAVDLGTTRVVVRLLDLESGKALGEGAFDNPQISVGADILARLHFAGEEGGMDRLHGLITEALNQKIASLCEKAGIATESVYLLSVAGNTAMTHLLLGIPCGWMIREPYIPAVNSPGDLAAADLCLRVNPDGRIFVFPNVGSYFGGDLIAGILSSGMHRREEPAILVDVGTNAEVVMGCSGWLVACAGAAGPALEGGVAKMGMMAGPGVIDRFDLDPDSGELLWHTIAEKPPLGICGSGLIDLVARLFLSGRIDLRGKLVAERCGERFVPEEGENRLVVVPKTESATGRDLIISQVELDYFISSKAAMYTILETLALSVGADLSALSRFFVAGTFGSLIDPFSAITLGMLPDLPMELFTPLGNSSLSGAALLLTEADNLSEVAKIREAITYVELNVNQAFMNRFSAAKFIPHTDPSLFPSSVGTSSR